MCYTNCQSYYVLEYVIPPTLLSITKKKIWSLIIKTMRYCVDSTDEVKPPARSRSRRAHNRLLVWYKTWKRNQALAELTLKVLTKYKTETSKDYTEAAPSMFLTECSTPIHESMPNYNCNATTRSFLPLPLSFRGQTHSHIFLFCLNFDPKKYFPFPIPMLFLIWGSGSKGKSTSLPSWSWCHNWIRSQIRWWLLSSMPSSATLPRLIRKHILMGSLSVPLLASMLAAESPVMWAEEGTGRGGWGGTAVVMVGMVGWWATRCYTSLFLFFSPFRRFFSSSM